MTNLFMSLLCFISKDLVGVLSLIIKFSRHHNIATMNDNINMDMQYNSSVNEWS
jgi:hypothetical protein